MNYLGSTSLLFPVILLLDGYERSYKELEFNNNRRRTGGNCLLGPLRRSKYFEKCVVLMHPSIQEE
jgi:hypothetical protein